METQQRYTANVRRVSVYSSRRSASVSKASISEKEQHDDGHVRVAVRCRPMSEKEINAGYESIVDFESNQRIVVHDVSEQPSDQLGTKSGERRNISHVYDFDHVFSCNTQQEEIYDQVCRKIVDSVLEGYNGTIFAYGQTGTGKTFTMEGSNHARLHKKSDHSDASNHSKGSRNSAKHKRQPRRLSQNSVNQSDDQPKVSDSKIDNQHKEDFLRIRDEEGGEEKGQAGIIPRTFEQIFDYVSRNPEIKFLIRASYLEIYQEEIRDLLRKDKTIKLELHERSDIGVYVKDLTSFVCKSIGEIERVMRVGNQNRIVAATDMNEHSSRSHAIFMITIEQQQQLQQPKEKQLDTKFKQDKASEQLEGVIRVGKLNLVDLAGSERQRKTNSFGQRQKESIKINLSLSALGNVINSLMKLQQQKQQQLQEDLKEQTVAAALNGANSSFLTPTIHTPYRHSKLTRLLQDSLGGSAKTLMIANIGPASYNYDETINTLNYASRARCIKNKPRLNEDPKDALLRELQREINALRAKLAATTQSSSNISNETNGQLQNSSSAIEDEKTKSAQSSFGSSEKVQVTNDGGRQARPSGNKNSDEQLLVEREFFELKQKLLSLESKLLNSDRLTYETPANSFALNSLNIARKDHENVLKSLRREQELELARRQNELANQADRERAIRSELERREEAELLAKQSYESIQQEIEAKRGLVWKAMLKVKSLRDGMSSMQQAYRIELDELEQLQFVLQRELKLKCLIMDNFIPNHHVDQLLPRVQFDERNNLCFIEPLELAATNTGTSLNCLKTVQSNVFVDGSQQTDYNLNYSDFWVPTVPGSIRPKSELERVSETINPTNIRYKYENLLKPTFDFGGAAMFARPPRLCDRLSGQESGKLKSTQSDKDNLENRIQALIDQNLSKREADIVI